MIHKLHSLIRKFYPSVVLFLATLGFFWRIPFSPDAWQPAGGVVSFLYPTYRFAVASLQSEPYARC